MGSQHSKKLLLVLYVKNIQVQLHLKPKETLSLALNIEHLSKKQKIVIIHLF